MMNRKEGTTIFNIGFSELILILLVAFLIVGPNDLPKVARWLGRSVKKMKSLIREIKEESGWVELEKEFNETKSEVNQGLADLKKDADVTADLKEASDEIKKGASQVEKEFGQAQKAWKDIKKK